MPPWMGPGRNDGHLDHQVVEGAGLHSRQKVHLRPAFHLEDADRIGAAQHVVGLVVLLRDGVQGQLRFSCSDNS